MRSAVLLIIYKREPTTRQVFEAIRRAKPPRLYIAANAPNPEKEDDPEKCIKTRYCTEKVEWPCEVKRWYREEHLTAGVSISSAISWFFENEEEGIILEDDVLPSLDFFRFCDELLERYRDEKSIMVISAQNRSKSLKVSDEYVFNQFVNIWGWATWKRAWKLMDLHLDNFDKISKMRYIKELGLLQGLMYLKYDYYAAHQSNIISWDTAWAFSVFFHNGIVITPKVNLALNVGIGVADSANYKQTDRNPFEELTMGVIKWPLKHPTSIRLDINQVKYDEYDFLRVRWIGIKKKIKSIFKLGW